MTFGEGASRIRRGEAPQNFRSVRNAVIGLLRRWGATNIATALRENTLQVDELLTKLDILENRGALEKHASQLKAPF